MNVFSVNLPDKINVFFLFGQLVIFVLYFSILSRASAEQNLQQSQTSVVDCESSGSSDNICTAALDLRQVPIGPTKKANAQ